MEAPRGCRAPTNGQCTRTAAKQGCDSCSGQNQRSAFNKVAPGPKAVRPSDQPCDDPDFFLNEALRAGVDVSSSYSPCDGFHGISELSVKPKSVALCNEAGGACTPPDPPDPVPGQVNCSSNLDELLKIGWTVRPIKSKFINFCGVSANDWASRFWEGYLIEQQLAISILRTIEYMWKNQQKREGVWKANDWVVYNGHRCSFEYWFGPYSDKSFLKVAHKFSRAYYHSDIAMVTNDWSNVPGGTPFCWMSCTSAGGSNRFLPNNERWVWLCGGGGKASPETIAFTLMHEMSHVTHYCSSACTGCDPKAENPANGHCDPPTNCHCDNAVNSRALVVKGLFDVATSNNGNYDAFAKWFYAAQIRNKCWPPNKSGK